MTQSGFGHLKHELIAEELAIEIRSGELPTGDLLPGETSLARRFSVSRNTVRAALRELVSSGLIATRAGKGSIVTFDGRPMDVRLGWARALADQGVSTQVTLLRLETVRDAALAERIGVADDLFLAVDRLRSIVAGPPISRECSRVPASPAVLAQITSQRATGSLTKLLARAGLFGSVGEQWVELRRLDQEAAASLERDQGEAFLWSRCLTRDAKGRFVELVESYLDPDHFSLHFRFPGKE
jgi:GntR family transcriptional regulator